MDPPRWKRLVYTIGHSTRPIEELVAVLRSFAVTTLDIRTVPRSRHNPQFDSDALGPRLAEAGSRYVRVPELGGLRKRRPGSVNTAWRNASFQGYADHMQTSEFEAGLARLSAIDGVIALVCAEAVPWRCHRSLVADALTVRGADVRHIVGDRASPHRLTPFAHVDGWRVTYPADADHPPA
jgi:uncharacterized protein (DUF488 family)